MTKQPSLPPLRTGDDRKPPPGELRLLQAFVNTREDDEDREDFPDPPSLERWLVHYELMSAPAEPLTPDDLDHVACVREALRAVLVAGNGGPPADEAIAALNQATAEVSLRVAFGDAARADLSPMPHGRPDEAIGRLLAIVVRAQVAGTWERLEGCPDPGCGWIFYDWSKNRSATWCSMETCGNRAKARAVRERRRGAHSR